MSFLQNDGLSHSEIFGSKVICTCPKLIAAYHVLHRLREPRHPPCALAYFLSNVLFLYWYWYWNYFLLSILRTRTRTVWYILLALTKILLFVHHVKDRFSFQRSWRITDSNRWPSACKADALASWANPPRGYQEFCFLAFSFPCSSFLSLVVPGRVELPTSTLSV